MDELIRNLGSASWWIGVVLVGIATSIMAAYAKPALDRLISGFSQWWSTRTEARQQEFLARVREAADNEIVRAELRFEVLRVLLVSALYIVLGIVLMIVGVTFLSIAEEFMSLLAMGAGVITIIGGVMGPLLDTNYQVLLRAKSKEAM
jgi:hypothetical protein